MNKTDKAAECEAQQHSPLERARLALDGDSGDEEHDALYFLCDAYENLNIHAEKLAEALRGAQSALRKSVPFVPSDTIAIYCGEWLDEIAEALAAYQSESEVQS